MLSKKLCDELNRQLNMEFKAAYNYFGMASFCQAANLEGAGRWFTLQAKEELGHAMKFYGHISERDGAVRLEAIPKPESSYVSLLDVFKKAFEEEKQVSQSINGIAKLALEEGDHTTYGFLGWFLGEQIEEEQTCQRFISRLEMVGSENKSALLFLDAELGRRSAE